MQKSKVTLAPITPSKSKIASILDEPIVQTVQHLGYCNFNIMLQAPSFSSEVDNKSTSNNSNVDIRAFENAPKAFEQEHTQPSIASTPQKSLGSADATPPCTPDPPQTVIKSPAVKLIRRANK